MWGESPSEQQQPQIPKSNDARAIEPRRNDRNNKYYESNKNKKVSFGGWDDLDVRPQESDDEDNSSGRSYQRSSNYKSRSPKTQWSNNRGIRNNNKPRNTSNSYEQKGNNRRYIDTDIDGDQDKNTRGNADSKEQQERKINMRALEMTGFVHLYGIAPVLNALAANRRDFTASSTDGDDSRFTELGGIKEAVVDRKPEAQFSSWLFVQHQNSTIGTTKRDSSKLKATQEIMTLANERGIPIAFVDKGVLNTLVSGFGSSNTPRPHQGFVLRCGALHFISYENMKEDIFILDKNNPRLWVALDEVMDPQNLGALLRSIHFFSSTSINKKIGVMVCAKNSAPLSPATSAASAGALELMTVHSTNNLPKALTKAKQNGWRVLGAAAAAPKSGSGEEEQVCQNLSDIDASQPTILVLGNEGSGLRTLVAKCCSGFVRIPGGDDNCNYEEESTDSSAGVDSLNVSVTGGILLWHFMASQ